MKISEYKALGDKATDMMEMRRPKRRWMRDPLL